MDMAQLDRAHGGAGETGHLIYRQENLADSIEEISALSIQQWMETGDSDLKLEPNWPLYLALEKSGNGFLGVVREDGRAIGFVMGYGHPHINSIKTPVATIPTYFVEPRFWRIKTIQALLNMAILHFRPTVRRIYIETEYGHSVGKLLERMGFETNKIGYMLRVP